MFTTGDKKGHAKRCLTLIFKVKHQGQVTYFGFSEILDLKYVGIDTKIKSASCIQPELREVIQWMCVTLSSKVNRQGHVIFFHIFDIPDLENVRIDTKINFVSLLLRKYHNLRTGVQLDPRLATTLVFSRYLLRVKCRWFIATVMLT